MPTQYRQLMQRAWSRARAAAEQYGGRAYDYFYSGTDESGEHVAGTLELEAQAIKREEFERRLSRSIIDPSLLSVVDYDTVKDLAPALVAGNHDQESFLYNVMMPDNLKFNMQTKVPGAYNRDYSNVSGLGAADAAAVLVEDRGFRTVVWDDNIKYYTQAEDFNWVASKGFSAEEILQMWNGDADELIERYVKNENKGHYN